MELVSSIEASECDSRVVQKKVQYLMETEGSAMVD